MKKTHLTLATVAVLFTLSAIQAAADPIRTVIEFGEGADPVSMGEYIEDGFRFTAGAGQHLDRTKFTPDPQSYAIWIHNFGDNPTTPTMPMTMTITTTGGTFNLVSFRSWSSSYDGGVSYPDVNLRITASNSQLMNLTVNQYWNKYLFDNNFTNLTSLSIATLGETNAEIAWFENIVLDFIPSNNQGGFGGASSTAVPEPATMFLLGTGLAAGGSFIRRKK